MAGSLLMKTLTSIYGSEFENDYNTVFQAVSSGDESCMIHNTRFASVLLLAIRNEHPECPLACHAWFQKKSKNVINISYDDKEVGKSQAQEVDEYGRQFATTVNGLSDYEKVTEAYDIVHRVQYQMRTNINVTDSAYDGLILGRGSCYAYAESMKLLLDYANVPCIIVNGTDMSTRTKGHITGHCWNMVDVSGHWCHVDATGTITQNEKDRLYSRLNCVGL